MVPKAAITLKDPPYALNALEPHMSKDTLEFHWGEFLIDLRRSPTASQASDKDPADLLGDYPNHCVSSEKFYWEACTLFRNAVWWLWRCDTR